MFAKAEHGFVSVMFVSLTMEPITPIVTAGAAKIHFRSGKAAYASMLCESHRGVAIDV